MPTLRESPRGQGCIAVRHEQFDGQARLLRCEFLRPHRGLKPPQMRAVRSQERSAVKRTPLPAEAKQDLLLRLRRIEGQARGVQRMVEEGRDCSEVISQLASIRAAVYSASLFLLKHYAKECAADSAKDKPIEDLIELMLRAS